MASSADSSQRSNEQVNASDSEGSPHHPKTSLIHKSSKHHGHHHTHHKHHKSLPSEEIELSLPAPFDPEHHVSLEEHEHHGLEHHDLLSLTSQADEHPEMKTACGGRVYIDTLKLIHVALCFMILLVRFSVSIYIPRVFRCFESHKDAFFSQAAFSTCSSLVGPIFQQVGILSLGIQNLGFSIGSLAAPSIASKIGSRLTMIISASIYVGSSEVPVHLYFYL
jgi:hypothetical protein